jgi:hypothetical protein
MVAYSPCISSNETSLQTSFPTVNVTNVGCVLLTLIRAVNLLVTLAFLLAIKTQIS